MSKHNYSNPSKEFLELNSQLEQVYSDNQNLSSDKTNSIETVCKAFADKHIKIDWNDFLFELEDNNFSLERILFLNIIESKIESLQKQLTNTTNLSDHEINEIQDQLAYLKCEKIPPMTDQEKKDFLDSATVDYDRYGKKGTITENYGDTKIYTYTIPAGPEYQEKLDLVLDDFSTGFSQSPDEIKREYLTQLDKAGVSSSTGVILSICQNGIVKIKKPEKYPPVK